MIKWMHALILLGKKAFLISKRRRREPEWSWCIFFLFFFVYVMLCYGKLSCFSAFTDNRTLFFPTLSKNAGEMPAPVFSLQSQVSGQSSYSSLLVVFPYSF